jgi:hypothetical protein
MHGDFSWLIPPRRRRGPIDVTGVESSVARVDARFNPGWDGSPFSTCELRSSLDERRFFRTITVMTAASIRTARRMRRID